MEKDYRKQPTLSSIIPLQSCPNCGAEIGAMAGGRDAVCKNCGYKDPCCE